MECSLSESDAGIAGSHIPEMDVLPVECEVSPAVLDRVRSVPGFRTELRFRRRTPAVDGRPSPHARICLEKRFLLVQYNPNSTQSVMVSDPQQIAVKEKSPEIDILGETNEAPERPNTSQFLIFNSGVKRLTPGSVMNEEELLLDQTALQMRSLRSDVENRKSGSGQKVRRMANSEKCRVKHNHKEQARRRRIRQYCDELNMLVPFCVPSSDKASTLKWTTAFLKYIQETDGDRLKQKFERIFHDEGGQRSKPSRVPGSHQHQPNENTPKPV